MTDHCEGCAVREPVTTISVGRYLMDVCELCADVFGGTYGEHFFRSELEDNRE